MEKLKVPERERESEFTAVALKASVADVAVSFDWALASLGGEKVRPDRGRMSEEKRVRREMKERKERKNETLRRKAKRRLMTWTPSRAFATRKRTKAWPRVPRQQGRRRRPLPLGLTPHPFPAVALAGVQE